MENHHHNSNKLSQKDSGGKKSFMYFYGLLFTLCSFVYDTAMMEETFLCLFIPFLCLWGWTMVGEMGGSDWILWKVNK